MMLNHIKADDPPSQVVDANPAAFFETTYRMFQQVVQKMGGSLDRYYDLQGYIICLRFAGPALIPRITPALEHVATTPQSTPDLTICLWDDASTETSMPPPPWSDYGVYNPYGEMHGVYTPRGEVRGYNNDRIRTAYHMGANVLNVLNMSRGLAIYWTPDAALLPQWETGAPVRTILHWWLRRYSLQYVHAGAVGIPEGGVLLAGKGGSGKSTTALSCLNSDLIYVSDDYCLVKTEPVPYVYNLYSTAKVRSDNIHSVPHLEDAISNPERLNVEKALFFLHEYCPEKLVAGFPIRAILVPRITGRLETGLTPATPAVGLSALTLSTIKQLVGAGPEALQILKQLVEHVPCYHLELGTDLAQIPQVILSLLTQD